MSLFMAVNVIANSLAVSAMSQHSERNRGPGTAKQLKNKFQFMTDSGIVFIHLYSTSLSMSLSEALPTIALILCRS